MRLFCLEGSRHRADQITGKELADMDIAANCVTPAAARTRIFDLSGGRATC